MPEDWNAEDGGCLDLFDTDTDKQPANISKSLVPQWNSFVFFEVSPISFHQVAEVLSNRMLENGENRCRISISGWFHGAPLASSNYQEPIITPTPFLTLTSSPSPSAQDLLDAWISKEYRKPNIMKQIQKQFLNESR